MEEFEVNEEEAESATAQAGNFFGDDSNPDSDGDANDEKAEPKMNVETLPFAKRQELKSAESLLAQYNLVWLAAKPVEGLGQLSPGNPKIIFIVLWFIGDAPKMVNSIYSESR